MVHGLLVQPLWACAWGSYPLLPVHAHLRFQVWAPPPGVSGVGSQLGFQLWAPSPLIWVRATGLQVSAGAAYPAFTVQGLRGEGCQRPWLLPRVL